MMWKSSSLSTVSLILLVTFQGCLQKEKKQFSQHPLGYYYQLISFDSNTHRSNNQALARLSVSFSTQKDSVFWDSENNFNSSFFVALDSGRFTSFLSNHVAASSESDSTCLLIKTREFYLQQFNTTQIPFFSVHDSIVKVRFKVIQFLTQEEALTWSRNAVAEEEKHVRLFFASEKDYLAAKDTMGFFWIEKPKSEFGLSPKEGDVLEIAYEGHFLNGRFLEKSPPHFELKYGSPEQVLKGLNYVIHTLKKGQNAKIILPSPLAFGEKGSSNGTVPPFTPLLYNIKIIDIKNK